MPIVLQQFVGGVPLVGYKGVGLGGRGMGSSNSGSLSWTDVIPADATAAVVGVAHACSVTTATTTATIGGQSMGTPLIDYKYTASNPFMHVVLFRLLNPLTGSQTVAVSVSGTGIYPVMCADVVYYSDVSGFGTPVTNTGVGTSCSLSVPSAVGHRALQIFGYVGGAGATFASYNQTSRWLQPGVSSSCYPGMIGDAAGADSIAFGASITSAAWGAAGVDLL